MNWFQKFNLIKSDPLTCARNFDHQVKKLIHEVLQSPQNPVGKVVDYFIRWSFKCEDLLISTDAAPVLADSEEATAEVIAFVDQHVTCRMEEDIEELLAVLQHSHSTCKKKSKNKCRFGFPLPPMPETCNLQSFGPETTEEQEKTNKSNSEKVKRTLDDMKTGRRWFNAFLKELGLSKEEYVSAIRSTLTSTRVLIKLKTHEIRINNYNQVLLRCWRANMDIQYVIDSYSCAVYIVTYIAKA